MGCDFYECVECGIKAYGYDDYNSYYNSDLYEEIHNNKCCGCNYVNICNGCLYSEKSLSFEVIDENNCRSLFCYDCSINFLVLLQNHKYNSDPEINKNAKKLIKKIIHKSKKIEKEKQEKIKKLEEEKKEKDKQDAIKIINELKLKYNID